MPLRRGWLALAAALLLAAPTAALASGFDDPESHDPGQQFSADNPQRHDTPNDYHYDHAEPDDETTPPEGQLPSTNLFDERFDLFGFPSARTRLTATYKDGPNAGKIAPGVTPQISGFNAAGAWKLTRGDSRVQVAILDTGINWNNSGVRTQVALNRGELPAPQPLKPSAGLGGYDLNDNGALDVDDYKDDPRVGKGQPTGQDLIKAFSNGNDADGNGFKDDIAGWDFFDDDNDPADASSYFAAENHGSGRTNEAVQRGNDGEGELGVCPQCQYVPLRIWDTFVSDQNSFAMGIVYAADNGVEVIEGADGGLYHSAFIEKATQYAYDKGVAQTYSGDDLNTGNHNFPAYYDHTMLIEGTVADVEGLGMDLPSNEDDPGLRKNLLDFLNGTGLFTGTQLPVQTYFRGANTTQFGGKSSISMMGPTGSTNTGKASGAAAIVIAAALQKGIKLTADETRELLEQTAEDVTPGNTVGAGAQDPAQPGFDTHFGYGRANVGEAVRAASEGKIPPEAAIDSPAWYAPVTGASVRVRGLARDRLRPGKQLTWKLQYGVGLAPAEADYVTVRQGKTTGTVTDFGTLPLAEIRAALAARTTFGDRDDTGGPSLDKSPGKDPYQGQFSVRLQVTSAQGGVVRGEDRQVLTALEDETLRAGFPKRLPAGGEAPLRYADLNGDNVEELVLPTEDGLVHAYKPDGSELAGWPVKTQLQYVAAQHPKAPGLAALPPALEPPRGPVVADVTGDGRPEVITTAGERIYAWDATGKALPGWPINPDPARVNCAPDKQYKYDDRGNDDATDDYPGSHPKCGFLASPALARLEGQTKPPAVVVPGLDGVLRAYRPDATPVPGFPRQLIDTGIEDPKQRMVAESINDPAVGDLDGDGYDDVVVATNETYGGGGGTGDVGFGGLLSAAGQTSRVYAVSGKTGEYLPGWPIKLGGIIQNVLPLIGPGQDAALVKVGGEQQIVVSTTSGPLATYGVDGQQRREMQQAETGGLNLFESAAVGNIDGAGSAEIVKYQVDVQQAANLLLVGQNFPYSHRIGAYDPATGATKPPYPTITDDYQFLSSSTVAKVQPGATNQVVAGTGLGLLHAYDGQTGLDVPGFPKVTGGWLFAPAALSGDGRIAAITREGFLFEWKAPDMPACQAEWPSFRHDPRHTGNYDADGTAPGTPDKLALKPLGGDRFELSFRSPGDDGLCGTATRYVADLDGTPIDLGAPVAGGETFKKELRLAPTVRRLTVRAADGPADAAFNLGGPGRLERKAPGGGFEEEPPGEPDPPAEETGPFPTAGGSGGGGPPLTPTPIRPGGGGGPVPPLGSSAKQPAKLQVARVRVLRRSRKLDVLAPITRRASGRIRVAFRAAGRTIRFGARVPAGKGRIRFRHRIPRGQARKGTGIITLRYPGDADTRPQKVRLRAARNPARLRLSRPQVVNGRLKASGTIARRARGHVRVQMQYDLGTRTITLERKATIRRGRWRLDEPLRTNLLADLGRRSGTVHSYTLFTGDEHHAIRGELRSYEVLPAR
ncbi:MAG TPA: S8 family serine peptidase [Solirubrobacteraceae bacterium]